MTTAKAVVSQSNPMPASPTAEEFSRLLTDELLESVMRPGQYLGNEWGAAARPWESAKVHLALAFPDLYELGMSNFGQRILYQIVNSQPDFMCDRSYAPGEDMEQLLRLRQLPLWGWESRRKLADFELIGFSLQYELTYTNVLNMLELAAIPVLAEERKQIFPLIFGGGPSAVNPEPMAAFMDFFMIGDGEQAIPQIMEVVKDFKQNQTPESTRLELLTRLAKEVNGVYVPALYQASENEPVVKPIVAGIPESIARQVQALTDANQPTKGIVPYLSLVHDRQVLEVRRGCDRGCRFCQPGYTFLPVRERSTADLLRLSKEALDQSGHSEYSMLSLCVSDYTSLQDSVRALNQEHMSRRASLSFPSQRADRMNLDLAEELKVVRKSGITLAPEAGSERLRAVINKGLNHEQIITAITSAYQSGWSSIKLYFMLGLPTETDEDICGIIDILKEANDKCQAIRRSNTALYKRPLEFTCTLSNTVPKPHTPFQWYGQITPEETRRRHQVLRDKLKSSGLKKVTLNFTHPETSLLETVISRGDRRIGELIYRSWKKGCIFDAWDEKFKPQLWHESAAEMGIDLTEMATNERPVGSNQPWDIVNIGLSNWWLVKEWEKAMAASETAPCTENTCHACGVCTELETTHWLAHPKEGQLKRNPFVKELAANNLDDSHPSLFFTKPEAPASVKAVTRIVFEISKLGQLRFISHLDLQHLLARAARRAGLNVAFTEGFNPSPKISLAMSLPLFQEAEAEVGQMELSTYMNAEDFMQAVNSQLPPEIQIRRAKVIDLAGPSLASLVGRASYRAYPRASSAAKLVPEQIEAKIAEILNSDSDSAESPLKDIRSGIYTLKAGFEPTLHFELELAAGSRLHIKPQDVLSLVNPEVIWRINRLALSSSEGVPLFELLQSADQSALPEGNSAAVTAK